MRDDDKYLGLELDEAGRAVLAALDEILLAGHDRRRVGLSALGFALAIIQQTDGPGGPLAILKTLKFGPRLH
jgi:hypothetical protein